MNYSHVTSILWAIILTSEGGVAQVGDLAFCQILFLDNGVLGKTSKSQPIAILASLQNLQ